MGVYGNYYLKRAIVALVGLGANQLEDAIYPLCVGDTDGKPIMAEHSYVLHFDKDELPPVGAFWSLTMYDAEGFQIANPLNRFALGDRDALKYSADGSLDLYIQHRSPGPDKETNWLPAPKSGELGLDATALCTEAGNSGWAVESTRYQADNQPTPAAHNKQNRAARIARMNTHLQPYRRVICSTALG